MPRTPIPYINYFLRSREKTEKVLCFFPQRIRSTRKGARYAFTLIEMLVVIAIIALLASLVGAGVTRAIESARSATCKSNMRQIGIGFTAFFTDHDGKLPGPSIRSQNFVDFYDGRTDANRKGLTIGSMLGEYFGLEADATQPQILTPFICPSFRRRYPNAINHFVISSRKLHRDVFSAINFDDRSQSGSSSYFTSLTPNQMATPWLVEGDQETTAGLWDRDAPHNGRRNWLYFDGHVSSSDDLLPLEETDYAD